MTVMLQVTEYVMEMNNRKHSSTEHGYYSLSHKHTHTHTHHHETCNMNLSQAQTGWSVDRRIVDL
jgi:hypothetical protein